MATADPSDQVWLKSIKESRERQFARPLLNNAQVVVADLGTAPKRPETSLKKADEFRFTNTSQKVLNLAYFGLTVRHRAMPVIWGKLAGLRK
jgi:hypothetical protein